jgi:dTDP-4-amino-4,6-dideoxygalactose transaminase
MITYGHHLIDEEDIRSVIAVLRSKWLTTGPLVEQFECEIEKISGAPAVSVSSGTAALHCAYAAIELAPGDEVITPPITFVATQATAVSFGAKIVFADVLADTANIDPESVENKITSRTKAIVAVDYAGHPADMQELRKLADKHKLFLIEDASHSFGSLYREKPVGSLADITTFSFFPTKNITTGEGGAVCSKNLELLKKARTFSRQGLVKDLESFNLRNEGPWHQEVQSFGLNYRLNDILCALGISQIKKLQEFKAKRNRIFHYYNSNLSSLEWLNIPAKRKYVDPFWHLYPVRVKPEIRKELVLFLRSVNIGVQVNYLPVYRHPVFKSPIDLGREFPNSEHFYNSEVSLPIHTALKLQDLDYIVKKLKEFGAYKFKEPFH